MAANNRYSLSKPYDLEGEMSPLKVAQLDEMLTELYGAGTQDESRIETVEEAVAEPAATEDQILQQLTVNISNTDIASGNTVPISLVPLETGKVIVPVSLQLIVTVSSVYTSSPTWSLRHSGIAGNLTGTLAPNLQATTTTRGFMGLLTTLTYSSDPTGVALVLFLNANPTGTGTATAKAILTYYLTDSITSV